MKKMLVLAVCMVFVATAAFAGSIANTKHNLSSSATSSVYDSSANAEICVHCHTPHNAQPNAALWNRTDNLVATYTAYSTFAGNNSQPGATSMTCLTCHDGAVTAPVNETNGATAITMAGTMNAYAILGATAGALANDHPLGLNVPFGTAGWQAAPLNSVKISAGNVECISCHDPHTHDVAPPFLRVTMNASTLCQSCHNK